MATPLIQYQTSTRTTFQKQGWIRPKFPLPPQAQSVQFLAYGFDQEFECALSAFLPAVPKNTLSTAAPFGLLDGSAILTGLSQPATTGAGMGKFTAQFQIVPATWNDMKVMPFTFPGFPGYIGNSTTRDPFTDQVDIRLQYDYYVLDPGNLLGGGPTAGGGVANSSFLKDSGGSFVKTVYGLTDIPLIAKTFFVTNPSGTPNPSVRVNSLVPGTGATYGSLTYIQTLPNQAHYTAWVAAAKSYGWQSLVWDGTTDGAGTGNGYGQLVSNDSMIESFAGNIMARITGFVLCK